MTAHVAVMESASYLRMVAETYTASALPTTKVFCAKRKRKQQTALLTSRGKSAAAMESVKLEAMAKVSVCACPAIKERTAPKEYAQTNVTTQLDMECVTNAFAPACARMAGLAMLAKLRTAGVLSVS